MADFPPLVQEPPFREEDHELAPQRQVCLPDVMPELLQRPVALVSTLWKMQEYEIRIRMRTARKLRVSMSMRFRDVISFS